MDPTCARDIIEKLALGIDPVTGAPLKSEGVFNYPIVIRALFMAKEALKPPGHASATPIASDLHHSRAPSTALKKMGSWTEKLEAQRNHVVEASTTSLPDQNIGKKWATADWDKLLHLYKAGTTIREIAPQLGRNVGGIIGKLVSEGVLKDRDAGYAAMEREDAGLDRQ